MPRVRDYPTLLAVNSQIKKAKLRYIDLSTGSVRTKTNELLLKYPARASFIRNKFATYAHALRAWISHPSVHEMLIEPYDTISEPDAEQLLTVAEHMLELCDFFIDPEQFMDTINTRHIVLGEDIETGEIVRLSAEGRQLSTYVIGTIGSGKSTLLEQFAIQDMHNGDGLCFLDPHEESVDHIMLHVPAWRKDDVILWDPSDDESPLGLNPFLCPNPKHIDSTAGNFIAALGSLKEFSGIFESAPLMKDVMEHLAIAFIVNQGMTLAETRKFLLDETYRRLFYPALVQKYPQVRDYWLDFDKKSERRQGDIVSSTLNKVNRFQRNNLLRHIFGQPTNSINFREAMDSGKIVLVKLSSAANKLGPENAALLGAFIIWDMFQAALSRSGTSEQARRQFHIIADEFQTYMTTAFPSLIEQVRKFNVDVTVAHQRRDQLPHGSRNAPLVAGNKVIFSVTGHDSTDLVKEFKIVLPEPEQTGTRPVYGPAPNALDQLATHGHDDRTIVEAHNDLRQTIDAVVNSMREDFRDREKMERDFSQTALSRVLPPSSGSSIMPGDYQQLERNRQVLESEINNVLYQGMQCQTDEEYEQLRRLITVPSLSILTEGIPNIIFNQKAAIVITAYEWQVRRLMRLLYESPILVATGQHEPVMERPRLYSDVAAEMANKLASLPSYTARCKLIQQGQPREFTIKTFDRPKPEPYAQDQAEEIRQTSRHLYGRPREEVEEGIRRRLRYGPQPPAEDDKPGDDDFSDDFWDED